MKLPKSWNEDGKIWRREFRFLAKRIMKRQPINARVGIYDLSELSRKKKHIQGPKGLVGNF